MQNIQISIQKNFKKCTSISNQLVKNIMRKMNKIINNVRFVEYKEDRKLLLINE